MNTEYMGKDYTKLDEIVNDIFEAIKIPEEEIKLEPKVSCKSASSSFINGKFKYYVEGKEVSEHEYNNYCKKEFNRITVNNWFSDAFKPLLLK